MWLASLPEQVSSLSSKLGLRDLNAITNMTYHYVLSGFQGDSPIILKLGVDDLMREAFALRHFAGFGTVRVLAADCGFLLLERAGLSLKSYCLARKTESLCLNQNGEFLTGSMLKTNRGQSFLQTQFQTMSGNLLPEAIEIACRVMKKLHQSNIPAAHHFPHIKDWLSILDKDWNIHHEYLQKARKLSDRLLYKSGPGILLHGDLHHENILQNGNDWVVIDPKGVIGSPMNEIWAFVMDMDRDIPFISQYFSFAVQDLWDWYFVHLILAACWNEQNRLDPSLFLGLAGKAHLHVSL